MDLIERTFSPNPCRHPWELARRDFLTDMIVKTGMNGLNRWLDVGSGDGWLARSIAEKIGDSELVCFDLNYTEFDIDHYTRFDKDTGHISYVNTQPDDLFDAITMFDVLEHISNDQAALRDLVVDNLKPEGVVFITVPAYRHLFTRHDTALRHYRRYDPSACRDLIARCGLVVEADGGLFHSLLIPRVVSRVAQGLTKPWLREGGVGGWSHGRTLTSIAHKALQVDVSVTSRLFTAGRRLPGLSYWALCRLQDQLRPPTVFVNPERCVSSVQGSQKEERRGISSRG